MATPPSQGTPETDKSLGLLSTMLNSTNPNLNMGQYTKNLAATTTTAEANKFWQQTGEPLGGHLPRYGQPSAPLPFGLDFNKRPDDSQFLQTMGGIYNAGAGLSDFVTSPRGLAELGATMLFPPAGLAFLGAEGYPGAGQFGKTIYKAATNQLPPAESAEAAATARVISSSIRWMGRQEIVSHWRSVSASSAAAARSEIWAS